MGESIAQHAAILYRQDFAGARVTGGNGGSSRDQWSYYSESPAGDGTEHCHTKRRMGDLPERLFLCNGPAPAPAQSDPGAHAGANGAGVSCRSS